MQRIIIINQQEIKLITTHIFGNLCYQCQNEKEIHLTSERKIWVGAAETYQEKKYCWSCALNALYQLEQSDYDFTNKEQIIRDLRSELNRGSRKKLWFDYYTVKKPECLTCWAKNIPADVYDFCGEECLIKYWIKYQSQGKLKKDDANYIEID